MSKRVPERNFGYAFYRSGFFVFFIYLFGFISLVKHLVIFYKLSHLKHDHYNIFLPTESIQT